MKRIVCILISISLVFTSSYVAYAISPSELLDFPYRDEWLDFIEDSSQRIVGYDGTDYAYNQYLTGTTQAVKYGGMLQALESLTGVSNRPKMTVFDDVTIAGEQYLDGQYRSARVTRDFIDRLYSNVDGYGINGRYKTLEDYSLVVDSEYDINNNISEYGVFLSQRNDVFTGYIDITNARAYSGVSFYSGSSVPPVMYIGNTGTVYQNGNMLPRNNIYFLMGSNDAIASSTIMNNVCGYMYRYGQQIDQIKLQFLWSSQFNYNNGNYEPNGYLVGQPVIMRNGVSQGSIPDSETASRLQQFETQIGVQLAFTEAPPIEPPDNIPYSDDDTVIILVPIDLSKEITYISNDDYEYNLNLGDITENNYDYEYNNSTVNLMINNFVDFYVDLTIGEGGSYDDTELQTKLDVIINRLTVIMSFITFGGEYRDIFSMTPIYNSYLDCVLTHIPYYTSVNSQIQTIITDSDVDLSLQDELDSWLIDTDTDTIYELDHVPINLTWYEPYRQKIRSIMLIANYILLVQFVIVMYRRSVGLGGA